MSDSKEEANANNIELLQHSNNPPKKGELVTKVRGKIDSTLDKCIEVAKESIYSIECILKEAELSEDTVLSKESIVELEYIESFLRKMPNYIHIFRESESDPLADYISFRSDIFAKLDEIEERNGISAVGSWYREQMISESGEPDSIIRRKLVEIEPFSEGLARVKFDTGCYGFIDKDGSIVIGANDEYQGASSFCEERAIVQFRGDVPYFFINKKEEIFGEPNGYRRVELFKNGRANVQIEENGPYMEIDIYGEKIQR